MTDIISQFVSSPVVALLGRIAGYFLLAWLVHRFARPLAGLALHMRGIAHFSRLQLERFAHQAAMLKHWSESSHGSPIEVKSAIQLRQERFTTLQELVGNIISLTAFVVAGVLTLNEFVEPDTIVWTAGLFGSALAFAGRTQVGDVLAGLNIIFLDPFDVGEKVQIKAQLEIVEGFIERVALTATWLRATSGELYIIPNGEMRFVCNYSRGMYSSANVKIKVAATDLYRALPLLKALGEEAHELLPGLREPWQVINEEGLLGQTVELTLVVRAHFGQAVDLRPQVLTLVQKRLALANIELVD